ncbi:NADPH:quinone oxidoreductase family protein [Marinobacter salicampi]|uniref:NADPH:quinone oxidoreductase family protein n=1 Tax=Marinobacter salicampi TaxID=435907 RepID=UPI00140A1FDB|nr:NADPH:quinone oxidoreductase family protein [Marinobacter salicampi]
MRAVICETFSSYRDLRLTEVAAPAIKPGCVRIDVHFASVSYAISLMVAGKYQRKMSLPFIPGTEVSGYVRECGEGVSEFQPGDPVAAIVDSGAFGEEVVVDTATVYPVPAGFPLVKAVSIPLSFGTASTALERGGVGPGKTVLITGAGGALGLAAVQIARLEGATVIAAASSGPKLEAAVEAGACHTVDYSSEDFIKSIKSLTGGRGAELVFDPVGGDLFERLIRCTAIEGTMLSLGFASGDIPLVPVNLLLVKNISLLGVNFSEYVGWGKQDRRHEFATRTKAMMGWLFDEAAKGNLAVRQPELYALQDFEAALDCVVGRRSIGKVVITTR